MPKSEPRNSAMADCRVSRSLPATRTKSPEMEACTLSLLSLIFLTMSRAFSIGMPCCRVISCLHRGTGGRDDLAVGQALQRHLALDQFGLQDVDDGLELELVLAVQQDLVVLLVELDGGVRILQVEALLDLLHRLLHGVVHFGHFDLGDYVKTVIGHRLFAVRAGELASGWFISNCIVSHNGNLLILC